MDTLNLNSRVSEIIDELVNDKQYPAFDLVCAVLLDRFNHNPVIMNRINQATCFHYYTQAGGLDNEVIYWLWKVENKDIEEGLFDLLQSCLIPTLMTIRSELQILNVQSTDPNEIDIDFESKTLVERSDSRFYSYGIGPIRRHPILKNLFPEEIFHGSSRCRFLSSSEVLGILCCQNITCLTSSPQALSCEGIIMNVASILHLNDIREAGVSFINTLNSQEALRLLIDELKFISEIIRKDDKSRNGNIKKSYTEGKYVNIGDNIGIFDQASKICNTESALGDIFLDEFRSHSSAVDIFKENDAPTKISLCYDIALELFEGAITEITSYKHHSAINPKKRSRSGISTEHLVGALAEFALSRIINNEKKEVNYVQKDSVFISKSIEGINCDGKLVFKTSDRTSSKPLIISNVDLVSSLPFTSSALTAKEAGCWGESLVYNYLRASKPDSTVEWVNQIQETKASYDIVLKTKQNNREYSVFIEVKTTRSVDYNVCEISLQEWQFATSYPRVQYNIYRVFGAGDPKACRIVVITDILTAISEGNAKLCLAING